VSLPTGYTISDLEVDPNNWILNEVDAITKDESLATISLPNYPISIYPTVVNTSLNIDNDNLSNLVAKIFSTEGKLISQKVFSGNTTLEMNNISSGNYIVEIQNENGLVLKIQQIVKQ
jgi:hypothetical protein